ncbi:hypothetical protein DFJ73DRAFT_503793 [Zopfochytrium polystomum]|nr:hypothetical protein DFJ73DRAFT_503793 [Zopfochytrium polystomum]
MNFNKKRGINAEMKQFKEQKEEAERFENLLKQKAKQTLAYLLWKLYHQEQKTKALENSIAEEKDSSAELVEELQRAEAALKDARRTMARITKESVKLEKKAKDRKAEVDDRKPAQLKLEERIKHGTKKLQKARENSAKADRELRRQTEKVSRLEETLSDVRRQFERFEADILQRAGRSRGALDEGSLAEYNTKKADVAAETTQLRQQLATLQRDLKAEMESRLRMEENLSTAERRKERLLEDKTALDERASKVLPNLDDVAFSPSTSL